QLSYEGATRGTLSTALRTLSGVASLHSDVAAVGLALRRQDRAPIRFVPVAENLRTSFTIVAVDARQEWIASPLLISAPTRGLKSWLRTSGAWPANRRTQMARTSFAASALVAASLMGAGALATASEKTVRAGADPVAKLAILAQLEKSDGGTVGQAGGSIEKVDDGKGNLHVPADYRTKFHYIGSWAVAGDDKGSKEMHTVYASPGAVEGYLKTGHFEDGAVLVKEVSEAKTEDMTTGTVSHVVSIKGWFVMVRDAKNKAHPGDPLWGDGWGWSWVDFDKTTKTTSTDYKNDCMGCHVPATPTDFIYVQGYPALKKQ